MPVNIPRNLEIMQRYCTVFRYCSASRMKWLRLWLTLFNLFILPLHLRAVIINRRTYFKSMHCSNAEQQNKPWSSQHSLQEYGNRMQLDVHTRESIRNSKMTLIRRIGRTIRVPEYSTNFCRHQRIGKGVGFSFVVEKCDWSFEKNNSFASCMLSINQWQDLFNPLRDFNRTV